MPSPPSRNLQSGVLPCPNCDHRIEVQLQPLLFGRPIRCSACGAVIRASATRPDALRALQQARLLLARVNS